ncbi:MAG: hypothetical protein ACOZNI_00735 [Myxococcota bacterium]
MAQEAARLLSRPVSDAEAGALDRNFDAARGDVDVRFMYAMTTTFPGERMLMEKSASLDRVRNALANLQSVASQSAAAKK